MGTCMSQECVSAYMDKLSSGISEYMSLPVNQRSVEAIDSMVECYTHVKHLEELLRTTHSLSEEDAKDWNAKMINADGTIGGHWSIEETNLADRPSDIEPYIWNVTMNMIYSDYFDTADKYMVNTADFYTSLARNFLFDRDGKKPIEKLGAYYHTVFM